VSTPEERLESGAFASLDALREMNFFLVGENPTAGRPNGCGCGGRRRIVGDGDIGERFEFERLLVEVLSHGSEGGARCVHGRY
jgi:hypothetical protein